MKHYKTHELIDFSKKFHYFKRDDRNGDVYDCFYLKLPSWGYGYDICMDGEHWGQRVLRWHGKNGFSLGWHFPPTSSITTTPETYGINRL